VIAVLAVIAGLMIWAPWVSKVPTAPGSVRTQSATATSVLVRWSPSTSGPTVDAYVIQRDGTQVGFIPGTVTSYQDKGLAPATTYRYVVLAVSGGHRSVPSSMLVVTTLTPPLSAARLQGSWIVDSKVIKSDGGSLTVGTTETDTWQSAPKCPEGPCDVAVSGDFGNHPFAVTLTRAGAVYTGTAKAHLTHCGASKVSVQNTVTVQLTVNKAGVDNRAWSASSWVGTMTISAPYTSAGAGYYCPAQSHTMSLTANR
jgi:chitodextrinase